MGSRSQKKRNSIRCPRCGEKPIRTDTKFGLRLDCCGLWAWGDHPLADRETHEARKTAHAAFDPIWKSGGLGRGEAYGLLAEAMGMTAKECHMKLMNAEQARKVPAIAAALEARGLEIREKGQ